MESKKDNSHEGKIAIGPILLKSSATPIEVDRMIWGALKQGNRKALDYIFEKHVRLLYAYGGKISKDGSLVEDCIQDVFVELWNKRGNLSSTDNIKFYLFKSLRRRIVRKTYEAQRELTHQKRALALFEEIEFSFESILIQNQNSVDQQKQLQEALEKLSKRQREAVYLKFYEKMTYEQMAEVLDIDLKSSYKLIGKALDVLRKYVQWSY